MNNVCIIDAKSKAAPPSKLECQVIAVQQEEHQPSHFELPPHWDSLLALPTSEAVNHMAPHGTAAALAAIQEAHSTGLRAATTQLSSRRLLWALCARLQKLRTWLKANDRQPNPTSTVKVRLDELSWSVACEQSTDGWPSADNHIQVCEESVRDELRRDGPCLREFISSHYTPKGAHVLSVEDIEQATWMAMYHYYWSTNARGRFLALSTLQTHLRTIARNAISKAHTTYERGRGRVQHLPVDNAADVADSTMGGWILPESQEEIARVWHAAKGLPPGQRKVFEMLYREGMSVTEIARKLNTSAANISGQHKKAVEYVRRAVKEA